MPLTYVSGEPVMKGDRIRYHGEPGEVEFIAEGNDPDTAWYVENFGEGCMITAAGFGSVYVPATRISNSCRVRWSDHHDTTAAVSTLPRRDLHQLGLNA
jgi:hypothetical protein